MEHEQFNKQAGGKAPSKSVTGAGEMVGRALALHTTDPVALHISQALVGALLGVAPKRKSS